MKKQALALSLTALLAAAVLPSCAPLTQSIISLDGSGDADPAAARLHTDANHPLLLHGLDGRPVDFIRVPSALRVWTYVVAPGRHRLWLTSMPFGHPLLPQRIRCYVIDASLEAGVGYVLREDPASKQAQVVRYDTGETVALGHPADQPPVQMRGCQWPAPSAAD
jgi:hypothetical protein